MITTLPAPFHRPLSTALKPHVSPAMLRAVPPNASFWSLVGTTLAAGVVAVLLGRVIATRLKQRSSSWVADAVAALIGWAAVVVLTGLTVGNPSDMPTVLYKD